ncbi:MAG TPA: GNAT family N-acetyltransferase [Syntrophales bacterium]|nr:GNAT family N-acetyltransferase [Syntrophales bacterium]
MEAFRVYGQYPYYYEEWITLKDGSAVFLRPVKPADGPLILDFFGRLSRDSIYFRFLTHLEKLQPEMLKQYVEIDYEKHFALAAIIKEEERDAIVGTCRYIVKENTDHAELTVVLRDDWQRKGLGRALVTRVVEIARSKGIASVEILLDYRNEGMKRIFASLGYPVSYETSILDIADRMEILLQEIKI